MCRRLYIPRMLAYCTSLVQRSLECLASETDSLDASSSGGTLHDNGHDSSDSDQHRADLLPPKPKRSSTNGSRSQRCPNRLARLVASRYSKNLRSQKRGSLRRSKQSRLSKSPMLARSSTGGPGATAGGRSGPGAAASSKGKRATRRSRGPRRPPPRARLPGRPLQSAPSSERTDSDDNAYRDAGRIIRPLRRRINLTRTSKRKTKVTSYRKVMNLRNNGALAQDSSDNTNSPNAENDENLALPSTSTGYRGQNSSALFRIAEVDSDDDQSVGSRPISPRPNHIGTQSIPQNLVSIVPTPINGSRDSIGDSLRVDPPESESNNSSPPPPERLRMNPRRVRRNGRLSMHRSDDSSETPPPKDPNDLATTSERLSPKVGYNRTVARLMNETNESELESSCSTEGSLWPAPDTMGTPDSGVGTAVGSSVGTAVGSSTRNTRPCGEDVSDDPDYQALKFRQRVKKARRNYRNHMDSDSN